MTSVFKEAGLQVTRWKASEPKDVVDIIEGSPTQQACAQSHIRIWRHIVERHLEYAFIMEDDITFDKKWRKKLKTCKTSFDLLLLNTDHFYDTGKWANTQGESFLTGAYIITYQCALQLLEIFHNQFLASDHMLVHYQKCTDNKGCYLSCDSNIVKLGHSRKYVRI